MKIDLSKYDTEQAAYLDSVVKKVESIYLSIARKAAKLGVSVVFNVDSDVIFDFGQFPRANKLAKELFEEMNKQIRTTIQNAIDTSWQASDDKYEELVEKLLSVTGMTKEEIKERIERNIIATQDRRNEALQAFKRRVENGMNLSDRVWNMTEQYKKELELAIDVGLRDGKSAEAISRDIRGYLNNSDKLFRRVRDKHGNLKLSKAAKAYHPGQGVYRSSYKNAMRVARTEVNMAYRTADYENWNAEKMVIGMRVKLSNNHTLNGKPFHDICDELQGIYPKDFKFTHWHPMCRCVAIPITPTQEEVIEYTKKMMKGEDVSGFKFKGEVTELPKVFRFWYAKNMSRVARMSHKPSFIADNERLIEGKPKKIEAPKQEIKTPNIYDKIRETEKQIRMNKDFETGVLYGKDGNILIDKRGQASSVSFTKEEAVLMKDSIFTHNHPGGWKVNEKKLGRIGNSFSLNDIVMAVAYDLEEIRAVTPLYTFSMKRPKNGWGVNWIQVKKEYMSAKRSIEEWNGSYFVRAGRKAINYERANAVYYHEIVRKLANKLGWEYTKIKG